jgi:polysaccharide export outer membrane protein
MIRDCERKMAKGKRTGDKKEEVTLIMNRIFLSFFISCIVITFTPSIKAQTSGSEFYKVGVNDVLEIRVLDFKDLTTVVTVTLDGTINFPYIGTVNVKDMKLSEIEAEITRRLSDGYIKSPNVSVSLVRSLSKKIVIYGEANREGELPFQEGMTLLNAISGSGGISKEGQSGKLKVRRKQKNKPDYKDIEIDLKSVIEGKPGSDIPLQPDDIVIVERNRTFFIQGEVFKLGEVVLEKDMTVQRAISMSGGVTVNGLYGKIRLKRKSKDELEYRDIAETDLYKGAIEAGNAVGEMVLQPDDIILVERNRTFFIQGEVFKVGEVVLEKDMTVQRAISTSGGVTVNGLYGKIRLKRKSKDELEYRDIAETDLYKGAIKAGNAVGEMVLQPDDIILVERNRTFFIQGEVSKVGEVVLEKDMTVQRAISTSGGLTVNGLYGKIRLKRKGKDELEYRDIAETDLYKGAIETGNAVGEIVLQPDDIILVERNRMFFIYGEVNKPGQYVLEGDMTVFKAIIIAGGFTKWGSPGRVEVLRTKENNTAYDTIKVNLKAVMKGDSTADVILQPGDTVIVSAGLF